MSHKVYKLEPGLCTCVLGDPSAGSRKVNVRKISALGILLEPSCELRQKQFVYTSVSLQDGPSMALSGVVISTTSEGILIQLDHSSPRDAEKVDKVIWEYLKAKGKLPLSLERAPARAKEVAPRKSGSPKNARDVTATIRERAKIVRSADLASAMETVQVLDIATIKSLIKEAVDESVALLGQTLAEEERKRLLEEAEGTFRERYEAEKAGLEEKTRLLQKQLEKAQAFLNDERSRVLKASQFTVSDVGMVELEQRLGRMLEWAMQKGHVSEELEQEMRAVVGRLLDDERQKIREQAEQAQNDKIQLLEKKVSRLATSLQKAEHDRDHAQRRAQALEASGGVVFQSMFTAGLDEDDPLKERKLSLLKEIVRLNKDMRQELAAQGRLPPPRVRPPKPEDQPKDKAGGTASPPAEKVEKRPREETGSPEKELQIAASMGIQRTEPKAAAPTESHSPGPREEDREEFPEKIEVAAEGIQSDWSLFRRESIPRPKDVLKKLERGPPANER